MRRVRFETASVLLAGLVVLAAFVAIGQSWLQWLEPVIDTGRDLYIPEQLRHGTRLYGDILYFYPPLTPYLLAAITAITGSSLPAYAAIGFASAALMAFALAKIIHPLAGRLATTAVLLVFVSFSVAGVNGWGSNFFFPYAHAATFGMLFLTGGVALLLRNRPAFALALLLAASWTKIEYAAFAFALVLFAALTRRIAWKALALYVLAFAATIVIAIAFFGADALRANIFPPSLLGGATARAFYARVNGTDAWLRNLELAFRGALLIGIFAWMLRAKRNALHWILLGLSGFFLANDMFFRAWVLLQLALLPFAIRKPREPLALLLLFSLCGTSRIFLNLTPVWYGFVFFIPVMLLIAYVLFAWLPERGVYSRESAVLWLPLVIAICASGLVAAHRTYDGALSVTTARGTYIDRDHLRGQETMALLAYLRDVQARELVVMPEGLGINYLSEIRTPLRHQTFTPAEIGGDDRAVVAELMAKRPQYVVFVERDMREFGSSGMGNDYGFAIVEFLRENYDIERDFGSIELLRAKTPT